MVTHFCAAPTDVATDRRMSEASGSLACWHVRRGDLVHLQGIVRGLEKIPELCYSGGGVAMGRGVQGRSSRENRTNPTAAEILAFSEVELENEPSMPEAFERRAAITLDGCTPAVTLEPRRAGRGMSWTKRPASMPGTS